MVDFHPQRPTMQLADPEDRALLGSNPSAAVGDGDNRRGVLPDAPAPFHISLVVLVRKAINPSFTATQLWLKLVSLTRPVCHLARSMGLHPASTNRGTCRSATPDCHHKQSAPLLVFEALR